MNGKNLKRRKLLVVEDDPGLQKQLKWCLSDYDVLIAGDRPSALAEVRRHEPAVIALDLGLPPDPANASEGHTALQEILELTPEAKVIVVTGNDDHENAVKAVGLGAYDFYQKPVDPAILGLIIDRAYGLYQLGREHRGLQCQEGASLEGVIAASSVMTQVCRTIEKLAPTDTTALLWGESGTGKELFARALHTLSARKEHRFVAINCAAIPETLIESELFGYEKGAFTGALKRTPGKIECADGGTLFLDEIGDLPRALQAKLLRFLQERVIERVGGREEVPVDIRVVGATHKDLTALIKTGEFREDLYYRISGITIRIPPLRERAGDAVILARALLQRYTREYARPLRGFSEDALRAIDAYPWPGNIRELENTVRRAVLMTEGKGISARDLDLKTEGPPSFALNLRKVRENAEREVIQRALGRYGGRIALAAETLGVSRPTLYDLMNRYGLKQGAPRIEES